MSEAAAELATLARDFATVIPEVDARAEHERWKPGIGPFEEERQVERILAALTDDGRPGHIETEVRYGESRQRCDLLIERGDVRLPVEAKLLRFRLDNGNIDPNTYTSVFSPFPEQGSSSLLTDARKLVESEFGRPCGLLGLYYESEEEPYERLRAERIAEKFRLDVSYWYEYEIETTAIERFEGLRHPHHQRGAVIAWTIE